MTLCAVPNFTAGFMLHWNEEMKYETNVIAIVRYLRAVALKWWLTSPSYINKLFVSSRLIWCLVSIRSCSLLQ